MAHGVLEFFVRYSTLLHLLPLRFRCVGGCWDPTQDRCEFVIRSNHSARSHPQEIDNCSKHMI